MIFFLPWSLSRSCCECLVHTCSRKKELKARTVWLGHPEKCEEKYPRNAIKNQKYNFVTFVPGVRPYISNACVLLRMQTSFLKCQSFLITCIIFVYLCHEYFFIIYNIIFYIYYLFYDAELFCACVYSLALARLFKGKSLPIVRAADLLSNQVNV